MNKLNITCNIGYKNVDNFELVHLKQAYAFWNIIPMQDLKYSSVFVKKINDNFVKPCLNFKQDSCNTFCDFYHDHECFQIFHYNH